MPCHPELGLLVVDRHVRDADAAGYECAHDLGVEPLGDDEIERPVRHLPRHGGSRNVEPGADPGASHLTFPAPERVRKRPAVLQRQHDRSEAAVAEQRYERREMALCTSDLERRGDEERPQRDALRGALLIRHG